jgi:hypothetical protein
MRLPSPYPERTTKRLGTILAFILPLASVADADPCGKGEVIWDYCANNYNWTISASNSDWFANSVTATPGIVTYYLWYVCADFQRQGMAAAEFDIVPSAGIIHLATTPVNGFLNAGGTPNLLLAVEGCPPGPVVAAELLTFVNPIAGSLCIAPSGANDRKDVVDCDPANPQIWPFAWIGLETLAPVSVDSESFSEVKARYR